MKVKKIYPVGNRPAGGVTHIPQGDAVPMSTSPTLKMPTRGDLIEALGDIVRAFNETEGYEQTAEGLHARILKLIPPIVRGSVLLDRIEDVAIGTHIEDLR